MSKVFGANVAKVLETTGRATLCRLPGDYRTVLRGTLYLDGGGLVAPFVALCTVGMPWDVLQQMPRIMCHDYWVIRGGAEWHLLLDGSLCLDFPPRWKDHIELVLVRHGEAAANSYAAEYLFNSAQWLLNHHKYAFQEGLKKWPSSWPGWPHNVDRALEIYARSRAA